MFGPVSRTWTSGPCMRHAACPRSTRRLVGRAVCSGASPEGCTGPVRSIHRLDTKGGLVDAAGPPIHLVARPCLAQKLLDSGWRRRSWESGCRITGGLWGYCWLTGEMSQGPGGDTGSQGLCWPTGRKGLAEGRGSSGWCQTADGWRTGILKLVLACWWVGWVIAGCGCPGADVWSTVGEDGFKARAGLLMGRTWSGVSGYRALGVCGLGTVHCMCMEPGPGACGWQGQGHLWVGVRG